MADRKRRIRRVPVAAGVVLASMLMLFSFAIYAAPHLGWKVDGLRSGSMSPQLNTGDMVVTRPVSPQEIQVNDVIIFHSPNNKNLISHRIVGVQENPSLVFQTKGDANKDRDPFTVPAADVVGKLAFRIPLLGYGVLVLQSPSGLLGFLVIPGIAVLLWCFKGLANEIAGKTKKAA